MNKLLERALREDAEKTGMADLADVRGNVLIWLVIGVLAGMLLAGLLI